MSNFTPLVNQEFEFQGDQIKAQYSRLKRSDMLGVLPFMKQLGEESDEEKQQKAMNEILERLIDVIPNYMVSFTGLKDTDGKDISIETVVQEFYFVQLAAQIATKMVSDSSATEGNV